MVRGVGGGGESPDPELVFRTLDDPACRAIVEAIDEPMSAKEISAAADVPLSTTYKKLDRLTAADLVAQQTELDPGGHHRARYVVGFERVVVGRDEDRSIVVEIEPPADSPQQQLLDIWSSLRDEA